mmetsp:Transcript_18686/g.32780  ORF Transcript_18686/g.32780 Transcript_18686/m.32780 type:complete len:634 (+) Transcript_18686:73-1974(+)
MYGHIHIILKDLILREAGEDAWRRILEAAGFTKSDEAGLLDTVMQSDESSISLVTATCKILGMDAATALHVFGRHFVRFALRSGHELLLKSQGPTLQAFLSHVNSLHTILERDHPNARFPFFEVIYDEMNDSLDLTYLSSRANLKTLVVGVVEEVGLRLYGLDVVLEEKASLPLELQREGSEGRAAAWKVTWTVRPGGAEPLPEMKSTRFASFPKLHAAMIDFMRVLRAADSLTGCKCSGKGGVSLPKTRASSQKDNDSDGEELTVAKRDSRRKKTAVLERGKTSELLVEILFRKTRAENVAASWADPWLATSSSFWKDSKGRVQDYGLSKDAERVDVFVSHAWSSPADWLAMMGDVSYGDLKSTQLAAMAKDIALSKSQSLADWKSVTFWVDKACIPQDVPDLKQKCILLIGRFIHQCDHVCVLFTWTYLERLWCVYELACTMVDKDPSNVFLQVEAFVNEQSFPLYLEAIRNFSIGNAKCFLESDRKLLHGMIDSNYVSHSSFEVLVKSYTLALMARSMAYRAGRSQVLMQQFFQPIVALAEDLQMQDLASALGTCKPLDWRKSASCQYAMTESSPMIESSPYPMLLRQKSLSICTMRYQEHINTWFCTSVNPVLQSMRQSALRPQESAPP